MKVVTFVHDDTERPGAVVGTGIVDLSPLFPDLLALIEGGDDALERARSLAESEPPVVELDATELRAPLPRPVQLRDCLVFEEHLRNAYAQLEQISGNKLDIPPVWYQQPIYYKSNRLSVIGPDETICWPAYAEVLDYELEMACVIGRRGRDIAIEDAAEHIFGFTIFNDISARDAQAKEMAGQLGPAKGKDFDTGNVLGPWIVTRDEIGDWQDLNMEVRVNGERRGGGNSSTMHHGFADIIAFVSQSETLYPGEVLGSGTVGTGCGLEIGRYLEDGDEIELEIENIGVLRNVIQKLRRVEAREQLTSGPKRPNHA